MPNAPPNHWRARTGFQHPANCPALPWQAPPPLPPAMPCFTHLPWGYADPLGQKPNILRGPGPERPHAVPPRPPPRHQASSSATNTASANTRSAGPRPGFPRTAARRSRSRWSISTATRACARPWTCCGLGRIIAGGGYEGGGAWLRGGGEWAKGSTLLYEGEKGALGIAEVGWTERRGIFRFAGLWWWWRCCYVGCGLRVAVLMVVWRFLYYECLDWRVSYSWLFALVYARWCSRTPFRESEVISMWSRDMYRKHSPNYYRASNSKLNAVLNTKTVCQFAPFATPLPSPPPTTF